MNWLRSVFDRCLGRTRRVHVERQPTGETTVLLEPVEAPWVYESHYYDGIAAGCHVYVVGFSRGDDTHVEVFRFHAGTPRQCDTKMAAYFGKQVPHAV